jgi:DNA-directed RNA polymerase subunit RPC12/RpoP
MALIKCSECGRDVSDKATSCPHCGMPISSVKHTSTPTPPADAVKCPNCGSTNVHIATQGFSTGKAVAGYLTIGAIGTLAGNIGRNNVKVTCLKCGKTFNPVEEKKKQEQNAAMNELMAKSPVAGYIGLILFGLSFGLLFASGVPFWVSILLFVAAFITWCVGFASK